MRPIRVTAGGEISPSFSTLMSALSPVITTSSMRPLPPSASRKRWPLIRRKPSGAATGWDSCSSVRPVMAPSGPRSTRISWPLLTMFR